MKLEFTPSQVRQVARLVSADVRLFEALTAEYGNRWMAQRRSLDLRILRKLAPPKRRRKKPASMRPTRARSLRAAP